MSVKRTVFDIFDFKNAMTSKTGLGVRQGHWKCHHAIERIRLFIDRLCIVSYLLTLVSLSLKRTVFEIFDFKNAVILKTGLGVRQGHWKCHHAIERI